MGRRIIRRAHSTNRSKTVAFILNFNNSIKKKKFTKRQFLGIMKWPHFDDFANIYSFYSSGFHQIFISISLFLVVITIHRYIFRWGPFSDVVCKNCRCNQMKKKMLGHKKLQIYRYLESFAESKRQMVAFLILPTPFENATTRIAITKLRFSYKLLKRLSWFICEI